MDEIRRAIEKREYEPLENPKSIRCIECDRVMEVATIEKHKASRAHKRRLRDLKEDALLEQDRRNGMF